MKPSDDLFPPETIDEQIAHLASQQNPRWKAVTENGDMQDALDVRLIHDLQDLTQNDERMLAQTRARLAAAYEARNAVTPPDQQAGAEVSEWETVKTVAQPAKQQSALPPARRPGTQRPARQRMVRILSGLVAILVIGSMLAIFAWNNGQLKKPFTTQPTATPAPVKKPTPPGVYTVFNDRTVVRIDPKQKKPLWFYELPPSEESIGMITIDGDTVYATEDDTVYALDAATGHLRWEKFMPDMLTGGPIVANGKLYAITMRGDLYELQPGNGNVLHTYTLPLGTQFSIYHNQNILYVSKGAELAAIDLNNGRLQWKRQFSTKPGAVISDMQISDGIMLMNLVTQQVPLVVNIQAFDVATGKVLWAAPTLNNQVYYVASLQKDIVYYNASNTRILHAYSISQKKEIWQQNLTDSIFEMSLIDSNTLLLKLGEFVPQSDNSQVQQIKGLVTLDLQHGTIKGQYPDPQQQGGSAIGLMTWPVEVQSDGTFVAMSLSGDAAQYTLTYNYTGFSSTCKPLWQVSFQH